MKTWNSASDQQCANVCVCNVQVSVCLCPFLLYILDICYIIGSNKFCEKDAVPKEWFCDRRTEGYVRVSLKLALLYILIHL